MRKSKKTEAELTEAREQRKKRQANQAVFKDMLFDKRRYRLLTTQELLDVQGICQSWIERKKKTEIEAMKAQRDELDKKIKALSA